jgi:hypothetical protein
MDIMSVSLRCAKAGAACWIGGREKNAEGRQPPNQKKGSDIGNVVDDAIDMSRRAASGCRHTIVMRDGVLRPRSDVRGMGRGKREAVRGNPDLRNFQNAKPRELSRGPTRLPRLTGFTQHDYKLQVQLYHAINL